jgi:hypothetical protein
MNNEEELNEVYLCFIRLIGEESDGYYRYEFIFTDNPDEAWGEGFEFKPCCLVNELIPSDEYITEVHIVKTKIKLDLIQNNCCFGMQDCMDGIVAVAYENMDSYENYPEDGRLVFMFGESEDDVSRKLAMKNILMM